MHQIRLSINNLLAFLLGGIIQPAPDAVIAPVLLDDARRWETHFTDPAALETGRRLIDQDLLRWLDHQPTYLPPALLRLADRLLPLTPGPVVLTHEAWVVLSHALVTFEIVQQHLGTVGLLRDDDPLTILTHLASLRGATRLELKPRT